MTAPDRQSKKKVNDGDRDNPSPGPSAMRLTLFGGIRPFSRRGAVRDALAGVTLAAMNIPP